MPGSDHRIVFSPFPTALALLACGPPSPQGTAYHGCPIGWSSKTDARYSRPLWGRGKAYHGCPIGWSSKTDARYSCPPGGEGGRIITVALSVGRAKRMRAIAVPRGEGGRLITGALSAGRASRMRAIAVPCGEGGPQRTECNGVSGRGERGFQSPDKKQRSLLHRSDSVISLLFFAVN